MKRKSLNEYFSGFEYFFFIADLMRVVERERKKLQNVVRFIRAVKY